MKNFINRATERIYEAFNGPKIKDQEYDNKIAEMVKSEKGMIAFRTNFLNIEKNFGGLRAHLNDTAANVKALFEGNTAYEATITEISNIHLSMDLKIQNFLKSINEVRGMTDEWMGFFTEIKILIEKRETVRRDYEHYDNKMEELMKSKINYENPKDSEYLKSVSY